MTGNCKSNWSCRLVDMLKQSLCLPGVENLSRGISDYEVKGKIFQFLGLLSFNTLFKHTITLEAVLFHVDISKTCCKEFQIFLGKYVRLPN